jgi:hypothetical protein
MFRRKEIRKEIEIENIGIISLTSSLSVNNILNSNFEEV